MNHRHPYLQAGIFLALLFTSVAMIFGSLADLTQQREQLRLDQLHKQSAHRAPFGEGHARSLVYDQPPEITFSVRPLQPELNLPGWPGCDQADPEDRIFCTFDKLGPFLRENIRMIPGQRGEVVVIFDVELDGRLTNSEVYQGDNPHLTAETMRLVGILQGRNQPWHPGTVDGKPEVLKFGIGIRYNVGCSNCVAAEIFVRE